MGCIVNTCTEAYASPSGGTVVFSAGDDHASVATFVCNPGYDQSGDEQLTCDATINSTAWPMFEQAPVCTPIYCGMAEHVVDHVCTPCPEGENNTAGDDSSGANTVCDGYLTNTLVIFLQLSGVYEFNPVVELAMTDSISNVLATEDIIAEVRLNNDTKIVNETTGEFAAEFFIFVQSQTSEDPQEVLTTNFVRGEFQQALMAEFEENDLGFTMSNFALREEPAAMEASEKTRAETVMMIILIFVVVGMGAFLFKL